MTNFDEIIERRNTYCLKYDCAVPRGRPEGILPLWVADMDFKTPPEVIAALEERARHGIFGYSEPDSGYSDTLIAWFEKMHGWKISAEQIVRTPGVVFSLNTIVKAFTEKGDSVLIQPPVYYPFSESIKLNERKLVVNPLRYEFGAYFIDFEDFEKKIVENKVKLFIFCSPHNPVGRVWTREELLRLGEICLEHNVLIASDEVHEDFVFPGHKHLVLADLSDALRDITITCTSPAKTFNLAGLHIANTVIWNKEIRARFERELAAAGYSQSGVFGLVGCKAAYQYGEKWLAELKEYLCGNLAYVKSRLKNFDGIKLVEPQGTYLAWLDCKGLGTEDGELDKLITYKAGLWLDSGRIFGEGGKGFQRINIACPRAVLKEAFDRLEKALNNG
jgi:Bifunctional PLP-dependent enzyme with beta-cystathionase and maltose regulon repressor activities